MDRLQIAQLRSTSAREYRRRIYTDSKKPRMRLHMERRVDILVDRFGARGMWTYNNVAVRAMVTLGL